MSQVHAIRVYPVALNIESILSPRDTSVEVSPDKREALRQEAEAFAASLSVALPEKITTETPLTVVNSEEDSPEGLEIHELHMTITEFSSGSGVARWFIGMGAGAGVTQLEGTLHDTQGRLSLAFIDRKKATGTPMLGLNPAVISDKQILSALELDMVSSIVWLLQGTFESSPSQFE